MDEDLKNAIYNFLYDDYAEVKALLVGGFHHVRNNSAEKDVVYPYGTYRVITAGIERSSMNKWTLPVLQIDIYDNSDTTERIFSITKLIDSKFDDSEKVFTVPNKSVINVSQIRDWIVDSQDLGDSEHWNANSDYQLDLQK